MDVGEGTIHSSCFNCFECGKNLTGEPCVKDGNHLVCSTCARNHT
jgi:hypothetical protein